jgi:hypothetical protein
MGEVANKGDFFMMFVVSGSVDEIGTYKYI